MRKIWIALLIAWPALMSAVRGYHDAGTVFGDMMVAGMFILCAECVIREVLKERRRK